MLLSRDAILNADDTTPTLQTVEVPEWGGSVNVRTLSGKEREKFENVVTSKRADGNLRAFLASMTICDEVGKLIFTEADAQALGDKSAKALSRVYTVAMKLNAIGKEGVEELEKNSDRATSGATPTGSLDVTVGSTSTSSSAN